MKELAYFTLMRGEEALSRSNIATQIAALNRAIDGATAFEKAIIERLGDRAVFAPEQHMGLRAASACALAASCLFRPWPLPFSGIAGALGAILTFAGDQLITMTQLGGIRLKYHSIWVCFLLCAGFLLMLCGAWTYTL